MWTDVREYCLKFWNRWFKLKIMFSQGFWKAKSVTGRMLLVENEAGRPSLGASVWETEASVVGAVRFVASPCWLAFALLLPFPCVLGKLRRNCRSRFSGACRLCCRPGAPSPVVPRWARSEGCGEELSALPVPCSPSPLQHCRTELLWFHKENRAMDLKPRKSLRDIFIALIQINCNKLWAGAWLNSFGGSA